MTRTPLILSLLCSAVAAAQQPLVLLDPARGGSEGGARIADRVQEKQVTLELAERLASLLRARGFDVRLTREGDADVSNDARAAIANTAHPIACVLLHATAAGTGVHLYTTSLQQRDTDQNAPALWDEAQAAYANRSHTLTGDLNTAFQRSRLSVSAGQTWVRPLDNMQCAAVAVEVSPDRDGTGADDGSYQGKIAGVIAGEMISWRNKAAAMAPPPPPPPAPKSAATPTGSPSAADGKPANAPAKAAAAPADPVPASTTAPVRRAPPPKAVAPVAVMPDGTPILPQQNRTQP